MKHEKHYLALLSKYTNQFPNFAPHHLKTTLVLLSCILVKETVNLNKLKNHVGIFLGVESREVNSHYKRLTRYFLDTYVQRYLWKYLLSFSFYHFFSQIQFKKRIFYMAMDGSVWKFGQHTYHVLVLSLVYETIAIPIFWINLEKKGVSSFSERKKLLRSALFLYPFLKRFTLLADREYKGKEWFTYLEKEGYTYIIRLCKGDYNLYIKSYYSLLKQAKARKVTSQLIQSQFVVKGKVIVIYDKTAKKESEKFIILLTNKWKASANKISAAYRIRWKIECLFKHLKTNGFNIEQVGMKNDKKVRVLFTLVVVAYLMCLTEGVKRKLKPKKDNDSFYESVFRIGYSKTVLQVYQLETISRKITSITRQNNKTNSS